MFTGMLHTHKLTVILFLLIYIIKTLLLLLNKKETLQTFIKKTKVFEMIVSVLFLFTGGFMIAQLPEINNLLIIKMVCVLASIPLAVIAYKRSNKLMAVLSLVLIIASYGLAEMSKKRPAVVKSDDTASLYQNNCAKCHGDDGKMGLAGAKDLSVSVLSDEETKAIIKNGKNAMSGYGKSLSDAEISALAEYIKTLRK